MLLWRAAMMAPDHYKPKPDSAPSKGRPCVACKRLIWVDKPSNLYVDTDGPHSCVKAAPVGADGFTPPLNNAEIVAIRAMLRVQG